jgi:hypothetical protein
LSFPRLLGLVEGLVGSLEERGRVIVGAELGDPGREVEALEGPDGARADCELHAAVELFGIGQVGLREDDRELVAAHAAGDVRAPNDRLQPLGDPGEDGVRGQVPDAVVDRLEVVDVEYDQRELAVVAMGTGALAYERLVEVAAVVQGRERVEVGELPGLAEAPRVLERGAGSCGQLFERS